MRARTHRIEVNNIFYDYALGAMWISILTAPAQYQHGPVPDWAKVETTMSTPGPLDAITRASNPEVVRVVEAKIREVMRSQHARVKA